MIGRMRSALLEFFRVAFGVVSAAVFDTNPMTNGIRPTKTSEPTAVNYNFKRNAVVA